MKFIYSGILIFFLPIILSAQGSTYKLGTTVRVNEGDTVSTNVIAAGRFVDIFGYLNDDLFSASRNLVINGFVNDDAIVAGENITMRGTIGDMLIAAGETIVIDGTIAGDLFAAGNEVRISSNAKIRGNVALAGNEIIFEGGTVDGWFRAYGNEINLDGTVRNFVELHGNTFTFGDNYSPASGTSITTARKITTEEIENAPVNLKIVVEKEETWGAALLFSIWFYVSMLIIGIVLLLIFRQTTVDLYRFSTESYFRNTGIGLLSFILIPIAIILLLILVLTIPLSVMIILLYGLALFISFLLVAFTLGTRSIRYFKAEEKFADYFWGLALGMILIGILNALPYAGPFINLLLIFFGLGTLLSYLWQLRINTR
jgi:hypothetical protein